MIYQVSAPAFPEALRQKASLPPELLYIKSAHQGIWQELMNRPRVAIVGSRKVSGYGRLAAEKLASELAARGVVIVSGLALGTDSIAHRAALDAGGLTIAVLPTPVEDIYPRSHSSLADKIIAEQGMLISEYPAGTPGYKQHFIARNRIVTGISNALLIVEAAERSGTLHTATFAQDQGLDVYAVPGSIFSPTSAGTNRLIRNGATPVTCADDILRELPSLQAAGANNHWATHPYKPRSTNNNEQLLLDLIGQGIQEGNQLLDVSGMSVNLFNHHLTMLEITEKIRSLGANRWVLG